MSQLRNMQKSMNAGEARALASTNSFYGMPVTYYGPEGEQVSIDAPMPGGDTIFDAPELAELIERNEKEGLMQRRDNGELHGNLRRRGRGSEWDHLVMTFSKDESRELNEMGPEAIAQVTQIIGETMNRGLQNPNQTRQVMVQAMHTNTGNFHVHALLHRFGRQGDEISTMIDQDRDSEMTDLASNINRALEAAGFDFLRIGDTRRDAPDVDRAEPDRMDADQGKSIMANARSMTPDEAQIKKMIERKAREIEERKRQQEADEAFLEEMQHALAAKVQVREAEAAREAAEAAREAAEAQRAAALEEAAQVKAQASQEVEETKAEAAQKVEAAQAAKIEAEQIAEEQTAVAKAAHEKAVELAGDLETEREAKQELADELTEARGEVEAAQAENTALLDRIAKIEAQQAEMLAELQAARQQAQEATQEATKATAQARAATGELEAERAAFSASLKEMADLRRDNMELQNDKQSLTEQLKELRDTLTAQIKEIRDTLTGSLRDVLAWRKSSGIDDKAELGQLISNSRKNDNGNDNNGPKR